ncbi:MAG: hypothetical protein AMJ69_01855 [Gammaproteobacteria bacterium SG8_47]|nr:MAG: hypothetical protein AMJ69_01855 [Gammaproteobacteria bacterium SG8_47]
MSNLKDARLRRRIAAEAARILLERGGRDYQVAKRKAAEQLGAGDSRHLPSNAEIEQALMEYQRVFHAHTQPAHLHHLREVAVDAMTFLAPFAPRLVGPVLNGSADHNSAVNLHVFCDVSEEVGLFLDAHSIPYELGERKLRLSADSSQLYPCYRFVAGDCRLELTVFPIDGQRRAPLSPVDGKPMRRASLDQVSALLLAPSGPGEPDQTEFA